MTAFVRSFVRFVAALSSFVVVRCRRSSFVVVVVRLLSSFVHSSNVVGVVEWSSVNDVVVVRWRPTFVEWLASFVGVVEWSANVVERR